MNRETHYLHGHVADCSDIIVICVFTSTAAIIGPINAHKVPLPAWKSKVSQQLESHRQQLIKLKQREQRVKHENA